jgi:hypothetical protein
MTLERSHGKVRITRSRQSRATVAADSERARDRDGRGRFAPGNGAGRNRTAKRSLTATLRAAASSALAEVAGESTSSQSGSQIAQQALVLYRSGARDVGDSAMALSHVMTWALNYSLSLHLSVSAFEAGADSDRGLRLIEAANACADRAARASTAALDFGKVLRGKRSAAPADPHAALERAFGKPTAANLGTEGA